MTRDECIFEIGKIGADLACCIKNLYIFQDDDSKDDCLKLLNNLVKTTMFALEADIDTDEVFFK